jgi:hypothetical protein
MMKCGARARINGITSSLLILPSDLGGELASVSVVSGWAMNPLLLIIILLLLFGGGGFYIGGPVYGGSGLGLVLLICLIVYLFGGFRGPKN